MKRILNFIDDILLMLGLISIVTASYMVNAVLGTYVLGAAFIFTAFLVGQVNKLKRK